jgi:mannose-6-phosphate isomerase
MPLPPIVVLDGVARDYAWGSPTAIPALLGTEPDGRPLAELWFGAHPAGPSPALEATLDRLIAADPAAALGNASVERFGGELPFLVKLLAADHALSIQVHPSREQAEAGFAAESASGLALDDPTRNYRDRNHKPELLCALSEFEAFCGFRPVAETLRLVDALALPELEPLRERLAGPHPLRGAFDYLLAMEDPAPLVTALTSRAADLAAGRSAWAATANALALAAADFPGDVGVALALLLNHVTLQPGEAIFLGSGVVHSYLRGLGLEVMANSDNVLRCGLTPKHVDAAELLRITDFSECPDPRCPSEDRGFGPGFEVPTPDFAVHVTDLDAYRKPGRAEGTCALGDADKPYLLVCLSGQASVHVTGPAVRLRPGQAAFVPARPNAFTVCGTGSFAAVTIGIPSEPGESRPGVELRT